jgi:hypothetical protein
MARSALKAKLMTRCDVDHHSKGVDRNGYKWLKGAARRPLIDRACGAREKSGQWSFTAADCEIR